MAHRVSTEQVDTDSAMSKRALGYLRWYPSAWRERYGEEFVAHLEIELAERPVSFARTSDIVAHGLLARFSFQRGMRIALGAISVTVLIAIGVIVAITSVHNWPAVTISSGYGGGTSGVGQFAAPSQVNDVSFNFTTRSRASIRITSVKVIALPGFLAPDLVGVEFAPHYSDLANGRGWPVRLPKGTTVQSQGRVPLVQAIGTTVTLARTDALWLGLRAPLLHRAYAVEAVHVTYERGGVSHTMVIDQATTPDVICASTSHSANVPGWCSQQIQNAHVVASLSRFRSAAKQAPSNEVLMVTQFALSEVQAKGYGIPTLVELRQWAARLFPAGGADGIRSVTNVVIGGVPDWRFAIQSVTSHSIVVRCTSRGRVARSGGVIEAGVVIITDANVKSCATASSH